MAAALVLTLLVALAQGKAAQGKAAQEPDAARRCRQLARDLELPGRRAAAAEELVRLGRPAVAPLLQQVRHPDLGVARVAAQVLAGLGEEALSAVPELQERARGGDAHAAAAAWVLARLPHRGTFLVPCMEEGRVHEIDGAGKEVWCSGKVGQVWTAQLLAGGTLLVAEVDGGVREYDPEGKVVWEFKGQQTYDAERLVDGNTLVTEFGARRVVEVDRAGDVVWQYEGVMALAASRLPGGATLICDYNGSRVIEVDREGKIVWELRGIEHSYRAERLADGSTLVVLQNQNVARRFDRAGEQIAEYALAPERTQVVPLGDGWLHAGRNEVERRDAGGKGLWKFEVKGWIGRVRRR